MVTAQHLDDQAETFMLALKRGSGPAGLSSMPELLSFSACCGSTWLLRPLLSTPRIALEAYMQEQQLSWVEDDSNQDDRYDRNFYVFILCQLWLSAGHIFSCCRAQCSAMC